MFASANDGSRVNNANFSPCSREMMLTQIRNRGQTTDGMFIIIGIDIVILSKIPK